MQRLRAKDLFKLPGVAETLDWTQALIALDRTALDPETVDATLGVLLKYQDDIARIRGPEARGAGRRAGGAGRAVSGGGQLAARIAHFARTLRAAGLPIGPGQVLDAVEAAAVVGLARRDDFYWALHAVLVSRVEHHPLFDEAFRLLWREPDALPAGMELLLPKAPGPKTPAPTRRARRGALPARSAAPGRSGGPGGGGRGARLVRRGAAAHAGLRADVGGGGAGGRARHRPAPTPPCGRSPRAACAPTRAAIGSTRGPCCGRPSGLAWTSSRFAGAARCARPPAVITLCDVSGSMARYARMMLRFQHALGQGTAAGATPSPSGPGSPT